jgi:molybdopterin-guanine dinucleotide biosynthesis protein A
MIFDAIVLAGGRASRLDGVSKADLVIEGRTLLSRTLDATAGARQVVVVGAPSVLPAGILLTREDPAFSGPAAAIAAGLDALLDAPMVVSTADFVLVLACDVPNSAVAVGELLVRATEGVHGGGMDSAGVDGVLAIDSEGRRQPLLGLYRAGSLAAAVKHQGSGIRDLSVRALLSPLDLTEISVPSGSTEDIDTWADATSFGISPPGSPAPDASTKGQPMSNQDDDATLRALRQWSDRLTAALGIEGVEVDIEAVLALAGTAAHVIMRPAAPLTTYLVGYAAGVAAASGQPGPENAAFNRAAFNRAAAIAAALAKSDTR